MSCWAPGRCRWTFWSATWSSGLRSRKNPVPPTEPPTEALIEQVRTTLLARSFFNRDPREVGPQLLGKLILRKEGSMRLVARIVEVEAYLGAGDAAAHAAAGRTERNDVLFGSPGHAYVYFIYGVHY